jgi:hypothetical protein
MCREELALENAPVDAPPASEKMIAMHEIKALSAQCSRERCPLGHAKAYRCLIAMKIRPERILQKRGASTA